MGLAITAVILLLYFGLAYFAAKTWQVWHVVLLVFIFIGSLGFLFLASATLKTQQRWRSKYVTAVRQIEVELQDNERLRIGSSGGDVPGELQLRSDIKRMLVDRGRVWRNLRLADMSDGQVVLDASQWSETGCLPNAQSEDDAGAFDGDPAESPPAAAGSPALGLETNAVVYAFKEAPLRTLPQPLPRLLTGTYDLKVSDDAEEVDEEISDDSDIMEDGTDEASGVASSCKVPTYFMGEYSVISDANANPKAVTLAPTFPLSEAQLEQLQDPNTTWVLYEVMPVDGHDAFLGLSGEQLARMLPEAKMDGEEYRALIESFARDQGPATDMDPPERKWMTIRFNELTQPETIDVDVDVAASGGQQPLSDSMFDPSGRSLVATLKQGEPTVFEVGDEVTFDFATAQELINQGKAEAVQVIYHRRLRDYAQTFRALTADLDEVSRQIGLAESDLDKLNESATQLQNQIAFQDEQRKLIASDLKHLGTERLILGQYAKSVDAKWRDLRAELSRLYRSNRELANSLTALP